MNKKTPEGLIVRAIADYLQLIERNGESFWFRVRNMSFNARAGVFIKTNAPLMKNGIPDICGVYRGRAVGFEVKAKKGALRETQKVFRQGFERAGAAFFLVRSIEDVQAALKSLDAPHEALFESLEESIREELGLPAKKVVH